LDGFAKDRVEIPIEVLNDILHDRSFYRIRIEVFDTGYKETASNKSESNLIPFTTGSLALSDPVIDWAFTYRNTYYSGGQLKDQLQCTFAIIDPNVAPPSKPNPNLVTAINVTMPDGMVYTKNETKNDFSWSYGTNNINFYLSIPPSVYPTGKVLYQATYDGQDYFFEDFLNYPRYIIPPVPIFGSDSQVEPLPVSEPTELNPLTLIWDASLSAKSYEARIDVLDGSWITLWYSSRITPVLENGNTTVSYQVPVSVPITAGKTYRWLIRGYDGTAFGDSDNRASSLFKYFIVQ
jgi:hypothetical protein